MEVSGQLHGPVALPPEKEPPASICDMRLGGPQSRYGHGGEEKIAAPVWSRASVVQPIA
jgi:hypothetical protein